MGIRSQKCTCLAQVINWPLPFLVDGGRSDLTFLTQDFAKQALRANIKNLKNPKNLKDLKHVKDLRIQIV